MRLRCILPITILLAFTSSARADTISSFSVNSTGDGFTLAGDLVLNTTVGSVLSADLSVAGPGLEDTLSFVGANQAGRTGYDLTFAGDETLYGPGDFYYMLLNGRSNLQGFTGGPFYFYGESNAVDLGGIALFAPAVTPEPSSIAFLSTGVLGMAGLVKSRSRRTGPDA